MIPERYAIVDIETTGFSPVNDRIVEIGCALVEGENVVGTWSTLVNPGVLIPPRSSEIHGITDAMVRWSPCARHAIEHLREIVCGHAIVAHNARFDLTFLSPMLAPKAICTMLLARTLYPFAPGYGNQRLRAYLELDRELPADLTPHRSLSDAVLTAHILMACRRRFRRLHRGESWSNFLAHHTVRASASNAYSSYSHPTPMLSSAINM